MILGSTLDFFNLESFIDNMFFSTSVWRGRLDIKLCVEMKDLDTQGVSVHSRRILTMDSKYLYLELKR